MAKEIERRFLVREARGNEWEKNIKGVPYRQGYLSSDKDRIVRVRLVGEKAWLTVKGITSGISKHEFDYPIPDKDAAKMLDEICEKPLIEKTRYKVIHGGLEWDIDVFKGENEGLILAEVELESEEQNIKLPPWAGMEVSNDPKYFNSNLVKLPFKSWKK